MKMNTFDRLRPIIPFALAALIGATGCASTREEVTPVSVAAAQNYELPATDEGLAGEGPLRRQDWFQRVWRERRTEFAATAQQDQGAVVFLGDSITQGWGGTLGDKFAQMRSANRGIGGDTSRGVLLRLQEDVLSLNPKGVVLLIGTDDIEEKAAPETIAGNVRLIIARLLRHNPRVPILLCEVFPSSAQKNRPKEKILPLNELYAKIARENPQVTLVQTWSPFANEAGDANPDEFPDLLHLNEKGYAKWAEALRPVLRDKGLL